MTRTRTYIIDADGTRFVRQGQGKRIALRAIGAVTGGLLALFFAAAIIGLGQAMQEAKAPKIAPTATKQPSVNFKVMQKACAKAPKGSKQDCYALYLRKAWHNSFSATPAGPELVKECLTQGYTRAEVADCLTQEI